MYKDPNRKVGSQRETPLIEFENDKLIVKGYQKFIIDKKTRRIEYNEKRNKFTYIDELLRKLNNDYHCKSIVDIGCNSGLTSFIAFNNNFESIHSLDHDSEYIDMVRTIKNNCAITNINESVYSFGDTVTQKFDVVFCGALIHWIFSLTANFRNFRDIMSYLINLTNRFLIIEWVDPNDVSIREFNHIKRNQNNDDEEYNTLNFERAVRTVATILSKHDGDSSTRIIYLLEKLS